MKKRLEVDCGSDDEKRPKKARTGPWQRLPQIDPKDLHIGCLNCSTACLEAPLDMCLGVGFGSSWAEKDGEQVADGEESDVSVGDIEKLALEDPDHDWRIVRYGPMHGETFQRHGPGKWVCIKSNEGFA